MSSVQELLRGRRVPVLFTTVSCEKQQRADAVAEAVPALPFDIANLIADMSPTDRSFDPDHTHEKLTVSENSVRVSRAVSETHRVARIDAVLDPGAVYSLRVTIGEKFSGAEVKDFRIGFSRELEFGDTRPIGRNYSKSHGYYIDHGTKFTSYSVAERCPTGAGEFPGDGLVPGDVMELILDLTPHLYEPDGGSYGRMFMLVNGTEIPSAAYLNQVELVQHVPVLGMYWHDVHLTLESLDTLEPRRPVRRQS